MPNLVKNLKSSCKDVCKDKVLMSILVIIAVVAVNQIVFSVLLENRQAAQAGAVLGTDTVGSNVYADAPLSVYNSRLPLEYEFRQTYIDTVNNYVYAIASPGSTLASQVVKIDAVTGDRLGSIYLDSGEFVSNSGVGMIDIPNGYLYLGTNNGGGNAMVVKININDATVPIGMSRVGSLNITTDNLGSAVLDQGAQLVYFATTASPASIIKVNINDGGAPFGMSIVGATPTTINIIRGGVIDVANQRAYFGSQTNPSIISQINLSTFTEVSTLTLTGENSLQNGIGIDNINHFLYVGVYSSTNLVKIDVDPVSGTFFTVVNTVNLTSAGTPCVNFSSGKRSVAVDAIRGYLYISGNNKPFCKVNLSTFLPAGEIAAPGWGRNFTANPSIDTSTGFAYFASYGQSVAGNYAVLNMIDIKHPTFSVANTTSFPNDTQSVDCAVIDSANGYAYLGVEYSTDPAKILKMHLDSGNILGFITLTAPENEIFSCVKDPSSNFAYFGTGDIGGTQHRIVKINLNDGGATHGFSRVGSETSTDGSLTSAVIDDTTNYAYFGTNDSPGKVVKVNLNDGGATYGFSVTGSITLNTGENTLSSAVIDPTNGYAYFGATNTTTEGIVVKVDVNHPTFARDSAITLLQFGEYDLRAAVIDNSNGYAYFGTFTGPGRVVKIDVDPARTFAKIGTVALPAENFIESGAIDVAGGVAMFGLHNSPARMVKINLNDSGATYGFSYSGSIVYTTNEGSYAQAGVIDPATGSAYFGTYWYSPHNATVQKVTYSEKGYINASKINAASTIDAIDYFDFYSHAAVGNLRLALYNSSKGLVWESGSVANTTAGDWQRVNVSDGTPTALTSLAAGDYWLAWQTDTTAAIASYTAGGAGDGFYLARAYGAFPSSITGDTSTSEVWSIYGGVADVVPRSSGLGGNAIMPNAPINMSCQALSTNTIRWSFEDTASNETGFRLYGPTGLILDSGPDIVVDLSYLDETGLLSNVIYADRYVTAYSGAGESVPSNLASCTTLADGDPLPSPEITELPENIEVGDVLQGLNSAEIYLVSSVNQKRLFPTEVIYNSWFEDYANIKQVSDDTLAQISLGPNMILRPGTWLMKITTDPKVYAVEPNGVIRWIETEAVALSLYGVDWSKRVIDMPDVYFVDYVPGESITSSQYTTGSLIQYKNSTDMYYVEGETKRFVSSQAFSQNYFQEQFIITDLDPLKFELVEGDPFPVDYDYTMTMTQKNRSRNRR